MINENKDTKCLDVGNTVVLQHGQACLVRTLKKRNRSKNYWEISKRL